MTDEPEAKRTDRILPDRVSRASSRSPLQILDNIEEFEI
jgi:hypothetical protein